MEEAVVKLKKIIKASLKKLLIIAFPVIIVVVLISGALYFIKENDGSYLNNVPGNTGSEVEKVFANVLSNGFVKYGEGWKLDLDFDQAVTEVLEKVQKEGGNIYNYLGQEKANEYLKAFIKAELITQYPDLRSDANKIGTPVADGDFQGCIQIHRALSGTSDGSTKVLTFVDENTFKNITDSSKLDHFTIDGTGNIVVAGWKKTGTTTTTTDSNIVIPEDGNRESFQFMPKTVPYKSLVEQYTMPFDLLWALTVMGEDPEFTYNLAQLALNSKIVITIQDNVTVTVKEEKETYNTDTYIKNIAESRTIVDGESKDFDDSQEKDNNIKYNVNIIKKVRTEENAVSADITYADTWIAKYEKNYSNKIPLGSMEPPAATLETEPLPDEDIIIATLSRDEAFFNQFHEKLMQELTSRCGGNETTRDEKIGKGEASYQYLTRVTEKHNRKTNREIGTGSSTAYNIYVPDPATVTEKTEEFAKIFNESDTAKNYIPSAPEWLFEALEKSPKTADMIDLVKYLLYRATKLDYGIIDFDFSIYDTSTFKVISTLGVQLTNYLAQFSDNKVLNQAVDPLPENSIHLAYYAKVQEATEGLNLSRQQLFALTTIVQDFDCLPVIDGKTFVQIYEEGRNQYGENTPSHNMYIWDNWWSGLGKNQKHDIYCRDAAFETFVKGILDFSISDAGEVYDRKYYIYFTNEQKDEFSKAEDNTITRTEENKEEIFTTVTSGGTFDSNSDDSRVAGYYTATSGRVFTVLRQGKIPGWSHCCNRAAAAIIASGYSNQNADQLINTINGDKAKNGWDVVPKNKYFNQYGLQLDEEKWGFLNVTQYAPIFRQHLASGGYIMLWVNIDGDDDGGNYFGKSGEKWTSLYHWIAIVDYKVENGIEQIRTADARGSKQWYDIDEFQHGIRAYALISEKKETSEE